MRLTNSLLSSVLRPSSFKIGCLVILISCLLFYALGTKKTTILVSLDNQITDVMFHWRGPVPTTGSVVIVDIDEQSLEQLGQWPWPRNLLARLVENIHASGARIVGFDMVFSEADNTSPKKYLDSLTELPLSAALQQELTRLQTAEDIDHDLILGRAVAANPTVLGYIFRPIDEGVKKTRGRPFPSATIRLDPSSYSYEDLAIIPASRAILNVEDVATAETEGFLNVLPDASGTVRKVPLLMTMDGIPYPSLALELLRLGLGLSEIDIHVSREVRTAKRGILGVGLGQLVIPTDDQGQVTVNFRGPVGTFPYIPAVDILNGQRLEELRDKYIIIGTSAAALFDLRATPFSSVFPGVEVHATVIDNALSGDAFRYDVYTEIGVTYLLIVIGGLLITALLSYTSPLLGGSGGLLVIGAMVLANYHFFFLRNQVVGLTFPLLTIAAVFLVVTLCNYYFEGRKKTFILGAFGHYVAPQVVNQLMKSPDKLSLVGEQKNLTILFSDIRGFTSISEKMDSQQLSAFMNEYLTAMSTVIMEHNGTVDKFIGDAIMAIWGAPLDDAQHAANGLRAAFRMMDKLREIQPRWTARGLPALNIGIGLNTGLMNVGNFGSEHRFDYTVMGDNVNLASRLEGANKNYGTNIIISEFTRQAVGDRFFCRFIDRVQVKGKDRPVDIYEPLLEGTPDASLRQEVEAYEQAVKLYQTRQFSEAHAILARLYQQNEQRLYSLYLERIAAFSETPPPATWEAIERRQNLPSPSTPDPAAPTRLEK